MNVILARTLQSKKFFWALSILMLILLSIWLYETPAGLWGKANAIAYAVCHRILSHSFTAGDWQMPLCARCTGMYTGTLVGMLFLNLRKGRAAELPPLKILIALGVLLAAFGLDGVNSYLHFLPGAPGLYEPRNWLRLLTGSGVGMGIAAVLVPVFHQAVWQNSKNEAALGSWKAFFLLLACVGLADALVLTGNPLLLYPIALLSALTVVLILGTVYTVVWIMLSKQENTFASLRKLQTFLLAGAFTAMLQISSFDLVRFWITQTWSGFRF